MSGGTVSAEQVWRISTFDYRPLAYIDDEGRYTGMIGDTIKAICDAADIHCSHHLMPYKRAVEQIRADKLDATVTINTGIPKPCCVVSEWTTPWAAGIYSHQSTRPVPATAEGLKGRSLIVVHGMESPYRFAPDLDAWATKGLVELHKATSIETAVRMFLRGRGELLWGSNDFSWYFRKFNQGKVPDFHIQYTYPVVFWVSKKHPDLLEKLNRGYARMKEENSLGADNLVPFRGQN